MDKHTCKHFCGSGAARMRGHEGKCLAGVCIASVTPEPEEPGSAFREPCRLPEGWSSPRMRQLAQEATRGTCEQFQLPTDEEIADYEARMQECFRKSMMADDLREEMRKKYRRTGYRGIVECPVCKGKLHMSVSSTNGHTMGKCETEECLNWIE